MPWNVDTSPQATHVLQHVPRTNDDQPIKVVENFRSIHDPPSSPDSPRIQESHRLVQTQSVAAETSGTMKNVSGTNGNPPKPHTDHSPFAVPSLPERYRSMNDIAVSHVSAKQPLFAAAPTLQIPTLHMAQFSSYNAALEAQALLEEVSSDKISPQELKESFMVASGNMSSALEELVSQVTQTSDELHLLNLNLQLCNNEVLLMNATLVTDDRLRALEEFFTKASSS